MIPMADLAAVLRHPDSLDVLLDRAGAAAALDALRRQELAPYVAWQRPDVSMLADDRRRAVLDASVQHAELTRVCTGLVAAGIKPVVFKGAAWAHTDYPQPWCRPAIDLDLLIPRARREEAFGVLVALGYTRAGKLPGELVNGQEVFEREIVSGRTMAVDLHWQVSNRVRMTRILPTAGVLERAVPAPFAGAGAYRMCDDDGLLIACLHPTAHHPKHTSMKWTLDVALIARRLSASDAEAFRARVRMLGVSAIVAEALRHAQEVVVAESVPLLRGDMVDAISTDGAHDGSRAWLDPNRDRLDDVWDDLRALPAWRDRYRLMREHLLPPPSFMRAKYGRLPAVLLPVVYAHRVVMGSVKWMAYWVRDRWVSHFGASHGRRRDGSADPPPGAGD
jgi:hypothetical protein